MPLFGQALTDPRRGLSGASAMSGPQKAAVIVRLMIADGVKLPLQSLSETMQGSLTEQLATLTTLDRGTVQAVVEEFIERIEAIGLSFPGGIDGALELLSGHISDEAMARLKRRANRRGSVDDPWAKMSGIDGDKLTALIAGESVEVAAVALSKLSVSKAAEILGKLPGDMARRIAFTMSQTADVDPDTVERIGLAMAEVFDAEPVRAFDKGPVERIGAILNFSPASTRDSILTGLEETDASFAEQVRRAIFTFTNIPARIEPRDIPRILRSVDQAVLVTAIAGARGADQVAAEFILSNVSQRLAASIREEAEAKGDVKEKDAEAAMMEIVNAVRAMEAAGEIFLIAKDED
jgi:flagellar motor switch protein FliG